MYAELTRTFGPVSGQVSGPRPSSPLLRGIDEGIKRWCRDESYRSAVVAAGVVHLWISGGVYSAEIAGDRPGTRSLVRKSGAALVVDFHVDLSDFPDRSRAAGVDFVARLIDLVAQKSGLPTAESVLGQRVT